MRHLSIVLTMLIGSPVLPALAQNWTCPYCGYTVPGDHWVPHLCPADECGPMVPQGSGSHGQPPLEPPVGYTSLIAIAPDQAPDEDEQPLLSLNLANLSLTTGEPVGQQVMEALLELMGNIQMVSQVANYANNLDDPTFIASLPFLQAVFAWGETVAEYWGDPEQTLLEQLFSPGMGEILSALNSQENIQSAVTLFHQHPGLMQSLQMLRRIWKSLAAKRPALARRISWGRTVHIWLTFIQDHPHLLTSGADNPLALVLAITASTEGLNTGLTYLLDPLSSEDNFAGRRHNYPAVVGYLDEYFQKHWQLTEPVAQYITNHLLHLFRYHLSLTWLLRDSSAALAVTDEHYLPRWLNSEFLGELLPMIESELAVQGFLYLIHHPDELAQVITPDQQVDQLSTLLRERVGSRLAGSQPGAGPEPSLPE